MLTNSGSSHQYLERPLHLEKKKKKKRKKERLHTIHMPVCHSKSNAISFIKISSGSKQSVQDIGLCKQCWGHHLTAIASHVSTAEQFTVIKLKIRKKNTKKTKCILLLRRSATLPCLNTIFTKRNNFYVFHFASLDDKVLPIK